ncbi:unnamed protein product [Prorocentrum cordatum]|uniref:Uncharacterized protein n=1 Tax=Prorocentrum cordatum TaxID=2364126 RepID=A0ABN9QX71_9DINO|nr:unnamed protein product [Polarella glacialis]
MTSSAPPPRAAPRTTSGRAARRARLRATHARKAQQASHRLAGLLAAGPPPGLCCDDFAYFYANQHAFEEQYAFEEQHAVTEHLAEFGHCEFVADAVPSHLGDGLTTAPTHRGHDGAQLFAPKDDIEQQASGEKFINEEAGDNQAPAISDGEPVASQLRIDSASPKQDSFKVPVEEMMVAPQELPPSEEPTGDPQQPDEILRQYPPLDFVRALRPLEREPAVKEFMARVPTESTDMQADLPTVDSKGLNDTACESLEVIDWRAETDEPLEQPVVEAWDVRVEDHPLSDNKELSDTTCGILEPAKKSDAKIKMKLKTHLFRVDFRNMSLRAVNRNGLGTRLRLCRDLL